jgi:hypothetical protein
MTSSLDFMGIQIYRRKTCILCNLTEFSGKFSKKKVSLNPRTGGRRYYFPWFSKYAVYWHCSDQRTRKTKDTTPTKIFKKIFWKDFLKITQFGPIVPEEMIKLWNDYGQSTKWWQKPFGADEPEMGFDNINMQYIDTVQIKELEKQKIPHLQRFLKRFSGKIF